MERTKPRPVTATGPVSISLNSGMGSSSVTTIATRPPKKIFSIVSWNVETYGESKANRNPYANQLIGLLMKSLEIDLLMLMETQESPESVISALQHEHLGLLASKKDKKEAFENIFAPKLAQQILDDVPQWLSNIEAAAQGTLPYQAISTAQTGKRPELPPRFGLFKTKTKDIPRCKKFFSTDPEGQNHASWKEYIPTIYKCYDLQKPPYQQAQSPQDVSQLYDTRNSNSMKDEDIQFVLRSTCFKCGGSAALQVPNSTQTVSCDNCAGTGNVSDLNRQEVADCLSDLLETPDIETYVALYRAGKDAIVQPGVPLQAEDQKGAKLFLADCGLVSQDKANTEIGFQDPEVSFNGRCPVLLPLVLNLDGHPDLYVPIVQYHAPFGSSLEPRRDSILALSLLGVPGSPGNALEDMGHAIVVGDFNLDYIPTATSTTAGQAYGGMRTKGFECILGGVKTSCMVLEPGVAAVANTTWPLVNAYDNFLVKGQELLDSIITACAIDVFDFMKNNASDFAYTPLSGHFSKPDEYQKVASDWPNYSVDQQMFFVYRKFISDHIPVLIDIEVDDLSPFQLSQILLRQQQLQQQAELWNLAHQSPQKATYSPLAGTVSNLVVNPSAIPDQIKHLSGKSFAITGTVHAVNLFAKTAEVHILASPTAVVYHTITVSLAALSNTPVATGSCVSFQLDTAPLPGWRDPAPVTEFPLSGRVENFQVLASPESDAVEPGGAYRSQVTGRITAVNQPQGTVKVVAEVSPTAHNVVLVPLGQIPFGVVVNSGQCVRFDLSTAPLNVHNVSGTISEFQVLPSTVPEKAAVIDQKNTVTGHIEAIFQGGIIVFSKVSDDTVYKFEIPASAIPESEASKMVPAISVQFVIS